MMKKYLSYILILIALAGIAPITETHAAGSGTCTYTVTPVGGGASGATFTYKSAEPEIACKSRTPPGIWTPDAINSTPYVFLAPLPCDSSTPGCVNGKLTSFDPAQKNNLGSYLNIMIKIIIGIAAVMSVVMIVVGGVEYMTSELAHSKESGKDRITHAIFGLVIALGAYALLYTINPALLRSDPEIPTVGSSSSRGTCVVQLADITEITENNLTEEECRDLFLNRSGINKTWTKSP